MKGNSNGRPSISKSLISSNSTTGISYVVRNRNSRRASNSSVVISSSNRRTNVSSNVATVVQVLHVRVIDECVCLVLFPLELETCSGNTKPHQNTPRHRHLTKAKSIPFYYLCKFEIVSLSLLFYIFSPVLFLLRYCWNVHSATSFPHY